MRIISYFIFSSVLICCGPSQPKPDPKIPTDTINCASACAHLKELHCPEGDDLPPDIEHPKGSTCEQFCQDTQNSGHALDPSCVMKIKKCDDMKVVQDTTKCPF